MHHHYQHIAFCLTTGQPYNQLAILASGKGDELATVYYYCRRCVKIIIKDTVKLQKNIAKNTNCNLLTHENQQQTHPAYGVDPGTRTRPHSWKASALSTAPSLLATLFLYWRRDSHFTGSSKSHDGLTVCEEKAVLSFFCYNEI